MADVEHLLRSTVEELDKLLNAKNVLGEPIEHNGALVIPLVSYGFGFGAGGAEAGKTGNGGGTGAGGGIRPVGAVILDERGARVEAVKGTASNVVQMIGETVAQAMDRRNKAKAEAEV